MKIRLSEILSWRLLLLLVLIAFIALKIPHLNYPFYWDASWPYSSAVHAMYENGPVFAPDTIDPQLSRGHPVLFIFLAALWMKIFGISLVAIHCFPLLIAVITLVMVYEISRRFSDGFGGLLAVITVAFQFFFFIQAGFLLLEIMLALFGLWAIYSYIQKRYLSLAISLSLLFFTKETGLVLGLSFGLITTIRFFAKKITLKETGKYLLSFALPLLLFIFYFIWQKHLLGWYFFPYHMDLVVKDYGTIKSHMKAGLLLIFADEYRYLFWEGASVFLLFLLALRIRRPTLRELSRPGHQAILFYFVVLLFSVLFIFCSALNFFIARYYIIVLVPVMMCVSILSAWLAKPGKAMVRILMLLLVSAFEFYAATNLKQQGISNRSAFNDMDVEMKMTEFIEDHYPYNTPIGSNAFLLRMQLGDPKTRYLKGHQFFTDINWEITAHTKLAVFTNKEPDYQYDLIRNNEKFREVFRTQKGQSWAEVYERIEP